jgi:hypothetical protein
VGVGDYNGDGILDLIVSNLGSPNTPGNTVGLLTGNGSNGVGDGTFNTTPDVYSVGSGPYGLAAVDFNGDGVPDVLTANNAANSASLLLNAKGAGITFTTSATTINVGDNLTLNATVFTNLRNYPAPTGSVNFYDGATLLGSGSVPTATFSTSSLVQGPHSLTAVYSGDATYQQHISPVISVTVNSPPTFTVDGGTLLPSPIGPGGTTTSTVTVTSQNSFTGTVNLSCTTTQPSITCSVQPGSVTLTADGQATATLTVSADTTVTFGNYTITVTGTSGALTINGSATLSVGDYSVSASALLPTTVNPGQTATSMVTATLLNNYNTQINLSCSGLPANATCAFSPTSFVPATMSQLTVSIGSTVVPGNYNITVVGTSGSLTRNSGTLVLDIQDFGMTASAPANLTPGQSGTSTVTLTASNGFSSAVGLTCSVTPVGTNSPTCNFTAGSVTPPGTSTLNIVTTASTPTGPYTITITGTATTPSGTDSKTTTVTVQVQDFQLSAGAANPGTVLPSQPATSTVTLGALNSFSNPVDLTCSVAPAGANSPSCSFTATQVTPPGTSTMNLGTTSTTTPGNYTITVTGTYNGTDVKSATVSLNVGDFSIVATTPSTVLVGQSVTSTVTIGSQFNFSAAVNLSCPSGLPSGALCSFNPASVTPPAGSSASSALTITGLPTGSYSITVQGGAQQILFNSTTVAGTVQDFSVSSTVLTPSSVNPGQSATATVTVTPVQGFASQVTLTCPSGLASGATCSFNPSSVTPAGGPVNSTLTVSTGTTTPAGSYTVTVQGAAGGGSRSTTVVLGVQDFAVAATAPATVSPGQAATSTVTVNSLGSFSSPVTLSCPASLSVGVTCSFNPPTVTPPANGGSQQSILTIQTTSSTPAASTVLAIAGTSGALTRSQNITLNVQDFTFTASTPAAVSPGRAANSTLTVNSDNGFTGTVVFTCSGLPSGASCSPVSVAPPSNGSASAVLMITTGTSTPIGTSNVTVTATSGSTVHTTTLSLIVQAASDFTLSASALPASVNAGSSATSNVTVAAVGSFNGAVTLSVTGLPAGATASFNPTTVTGGGVSVLTIQTADSTPAGISALSVIATSGALSHSQPLTLTVVTTPDFSLAVNSPVSVAQGGSATSTVTVTSLMSFNGTVTLTCSGLPSGATCSANPGAVTPTVNGTGTSTLTVNAGVSTPVGTSMVTVTGVSGATSHSTTLTLAVQGPAAFTVSASNLVPATVNAGNSATSTVTVTSQNGFNAAVSLACPSGLPANATCSFSPASVTPAANGTATATLTLATKAATPVGASTVTVTGTSNALSASTTLALNVAAATDFSMTASPVSGSVSAGGSLTSTLTVTSQGGFDSAVALTCSVSPTPALAPTCALSPASVTPAAGGTATSMLSLHTTAASAALVRPAIGPDARSLLALWLPIPGIALLGAGLASSKRRKRLVQLLAVCAFVIGLAVMVGCGGGSSSSGGGTGGTPSGSYTVTVTGTSGGTSHTTTVTLSVQ